MKYGNGSNRHAVQPVRTRNRRVAWRGVASSGGRRTHVVNELWSANAKKH